MSRKDYVLIAETLRETRETCLAMFEPHHADGVADAAKALTFALGNENPRFDGLRFLRAVGLSDEEIGAQR